MKPIYLKPATIFLIFICLILQEVNGQALSLKDSFTNHQIESTTKNNFSRTTLETKFLNDNNCRELQISNGFENGLLIENNLKIVDDLKFSENILSFSVESVTTNLINSLGVASVSLYFYEDNNGSPGSLVSSSLDIIPTSQMDIGGTFGFTVYQTVIDLPEPILLQGNGMSEVTYWFRIAAIPKNGDTFVAWESKSILTNNPIFFDTDQNDSDDWILSQDAEDMVFEINGSCIYIDICLPVTNLQLKDRKNDTAIFVWDINEPAENGYIIEVYEDEADPETSTPVFSSIVPTGINTALVTGLEVITPYDFYIKADCGSEGTSEVVKLDFRSSVPDPVCDGVFYDTGGPNEPFGFNEDITYRITPEVPDEVVTVIFTKVALEPPFDVLTVDVGDGNILEVPNVNTANNDIPLRYISKAEDGALIFRFTSNEIVPLDGWEATVSCALPATCDVVENFVHTGGVPFTGSFSWDPIDNAIQGYTLSVFESGADINTDIPIATAKVLSGSTSGTVTTLEPATEYIACINSDCSVDDGSSLSTCINFKTGPGPVFCGDMFFDLNGAFEPYQNNETYSLLIENQNPSEVLGIQFLEVDIEAEFDFLRVYDGDNESANELTGNFGVLTPQTIYSEKPGGNLFVTFTSDQSSVGEGWEARIACIRVGDCQKPSNLTHKITSDTETIFSLPDSNPEIPGYTMKIYRSGTDITRERPVYTNNRIRNDATEIKVQRRLSPNTKYDVYFQAICQNKITSAPLIYSYNTGPSAPKCGEIFTDSNAIVVPDFGIQSYDNNERYSYTIIPNSFREIVELDFIFVDLELGYDFLRIYDGPDANSPELTGPNGVDRNGKYATSNPGRPMYITFMSDESVNFEGWKATVTCRRIENNTIGHRKAIKSTASVSPNPYQSFIQIETPELLEKIVIHNLLGQKVFSKKQLGTKSTQLNLSSLHNGMYLIYLISGGKIWTKKLIKE